MTAPRRPIPGRVRPYDFPAVHRAELANGVRVIVAPMPRLPLVTAIALVDAGAVAELRGRDGVASLTARSLIEGAAGLDGAALASRLERLGTSITADAEWDSTIAQMTATSNRFGEAFALLAEVVQRPTFPARDVHRLRDERLADIEQQLAEPRGLADERFVGFLYARGARYGHAAAGSAASVRALDRDIVATFHSGVYGPSTTTLVMVGDITPERAVALVEQRFGAWRASRASPLPSPVVDAVRRAERRGVIVAKEEAPQSELRVGHVGVPRQHPDHLPIVVMNAILGGLFSSRINLNLREKHAFTYGASSVFDWRRAAGPFVVSTAVKTEVTARAVEEILREIDAMRAAPPSVSEVELATAYLAGVFPIRYETTAAVAGALARATTFGLGDDWFVRYRDRVLAVTPAQVHAAANAHLDPSRLLVLAVGDAAAIRGPLETVGIGPVTSVAVDAEPVESEQ
jgi:zinc protease